MKCSTDTITRIFKVFKVCPSFLIAFLDISRKQGGRERQTKTICQHHHQPIKAVFCSSSTRMLANSKSLGAQISAKTKLNTLNMLELFIFHWPTSTLVCKQKTNTWARFPIALDQSISMICSSSSWLLAINYYIWRKYMKKACTKKNSRELYRKKSQKWKCRTEMFFLLRTFRNSYHKSHI